jgi:methylmalonyl-CoA/ethylmalonyl-CoA epimerase
LQFDHIGLVVSSLSGGRQHLSLAFHIVEWTAEFADTNNGVFVQFGRDPSGVCYELIAPLDEQSPIAHTLRRGDRILNHVAYLVENLEVEVSRLSQLSFDPIGQPKPAIAYDHRRIQFFRSPLRFIVELIEYPRHEHAYSLIGHQSP